MASPLIISKNLSKLYQMGEATVTALKEASFKLNPGELVVVLGPSGSGKSTLFHIIGGMDFPTGGELYHQGKALHQATARELTLYRRHQVGFVFRFYNLMPNLTALENIHLSVQVSPNPLSPPELLEKVGLGDRVHHFPAQLSGGEQQRVA